MISALPTPLPKLSQPSTPEQWHAAPLATVTTTLSTKNGPATETTPFRSTPSWRHGVAFKPTSPYPIDDRLALANRQPNLAITVVDTKDLAEAVRVANAVTLSSTRPDGSPDWVATAVIQSTDGYYYVAPLGSIDGSTRKPVVHGLHIDGPNVEGTILDVRRSIPAVKAIVGGESWVNFTGKDLKVGLASASA